MIDPAAGVLVAATLAVALRILLIVAIMLIALSLIRRTAPRVALLMVRVEGSSVDVDKRRQTLASLVRRTATAVVVVLSAFTLLSAVGIDITPVLAGLGVAGIAVGLGAQTLVRDLVGGVFIVIENQFGKGDVVRIAGVAGMVEDVTLRRTLLRDLDGIVHTVPNGEIGVASNFTRGYSRVNLDVEVAYKEDTDRVRDVIDGVGAALAQEAEWSGRIIEAPKVLRVDALGESGVTLKVLATTVPLEQWNVAGELRRRIKKAFDAEGIEIPFPHRVVITREGR
jgi:small conductance mechanosensitive channel